MGLAPLRQGLFTSCWASQITGQSLTMVQGCIQQRWDFLGKERLRMHLVYHWHGGGLLIGCSVT